MGAAARLVSYNQPMPRFFGKPLRPWPVAIGFLCLVLLAAVSQGDNAQGQSQTPSPFPPPTPQQNGGRPPFGQEPDTSQDPALHHAQEEAAKRRNIDRQNKLKANSDRIVQLATELSTAVEPNDKDPASPAMAKKAEEIEKLAHSVKELMKSE